MDIASNDFYELVGVKQKKKHRVWFWRKANHCANI